MIKHSISFTYSDFTPDFTSLSALRNMTVEQLHSLLPEHSILGHLFVVKARVYGTWLELETLLSNYCKRHRLKRLS